MQDARYIHKNICNIVVRAVLKFVSTNCVEICCVGRELRLSRRNLLNVVI
jgi:hypothetical protein